MTDYKKRKTAENDNEDSIVMDHPEDVEHDQTFEDDLSYLIQLFQKVILDYNNNQNVLPTITIIHNATGSFIYSYRIIH